MFVNAPARPLRRFALYLSINGGNTGSLPRPVFKLQKTKVEIPGLGGTSHEHRNINKDSSSLRLSLCKMGPQST